MTYIEIPVPSETFLNHKSCTEAIDILTYVIKHSQELPFEQLPLHINHYHPTIRRIVEERLKNSIFIDISVFKVKCTGSGIGFILECRAQLQ